MKDSLEVRVPLGYVVLISILLVLSQYIIDGWVSDYGADPDVVSHVSFAGTLVSLVLALLAIIYAYYQTFAQQRDSGAISAQIEVLRNTIVQSKDTQLDLSNDLNRLSEISQKIDRAISIGEESTKQSIETRREIQEVLASETQKKERAQEQSNDSLDNKDVVAELLVARAYYLQICVYYVLCAACKNNMEPVDAFTKFMQPTIPSDKMSWLKEYLEGFLIANWYSLLDLGVCTVDGSRRAESVTSVFSARVSERFESQMNVVPDTNWVDMKEIYRLVKAG
jgi:hypothetical protein